MNIQLNQQYLVVKFDRSHNKSIAKGLNGLDIVRADYWIFKEGDEENHTKYEENINYLETNPQICEVVQGHGRWRKGDRIFVHYMAYETAEYSLSGDDGAVLIDVDFVFFKILPDGTFELNDNVYLGEAIYDEAKLTQTGLILDFSPKKNALKVKITHLPPNRPDRGCIQAGDTIYSIDDKNYEFNYIGGKRYVKLLNWEIGAVEKKGKIVPLAI